MDEIVPHLWIGNLPSALDVESLKTRKIFSVVTAMRGKVTINAVRRLCFRLWFKTDTSISRQTFNKYQINIDDSADEDVLVHFLPSISFIQKELDKGRGVLVHCQAGISRSATIVAAYLMYTRKLDPSAALDTIRAVRPHTDPNEGFLQQLEIFHQASYKISRRSKPVRMFYMERTLEEVMNGDGSVPPGDMFARYPQTPGSESAPNTPVIVPSRRIRCKMCRQELATREHMLDHGQLGPPTPALPSLSPVPSRRPSNAIPFAPLSRRPSASLNVTISRRPSTSQPRSRLNSGSNGIGEGRQAVLAALGGRGLLESLSMSALETEDTADESEADEPASSTAAPLNPPSRRPSGSDVWPFRPSRRSMEAIGRDLSHALEESMADDAVESPEALGASSPSVDTIKRTSSPQPISTGGTQYASSTDLAAQLSSNPKLAALRTAASLSMTGLNGSKVAGMSPPILVNSKCSGYFVEPVMPVPSSPPLF
ncbi:protein-tyrosine phosphatase-like protein [Butyriboletus roseoflavus]|nr:protein-tyrosine phosphatase-like protein [Butyriboletus roseoflavus]